MIRYFLSLDGEILRAIAGSKAQFQINTNDGEMFIDVHEAVVSTSYYDFDAKRFVALDPAPSKHHIFDYAQKVWIDPRTLDEIKDHKWIEIKHQREATEYGGFLFEGYFYDSDMTSQARIANASDLGVAMDWTTQDNQVVFLSAEQLKALKMALAQHIALCHEKGRVARKLIYESETLEQIASVTY